MEAFFVGLISFLVLCVVFTLLNKFLFKKDCRTFDTDYPVDTEFGLYTPGDLVFDRIGNLFTRKYPRRTFDYVLAFLLSLLLLVFLSPFIFYFLEILI